ncbi:zinc-binding metallopeptidase family protein [Lentisalinibacter salinarum]|uniref:zinc-binding metallopeptidase family protein n=1 Tax=Lentisalinibacter salinarum TaxID=2992239 RepID=UPI003870825B
MKKFHCICGNRLYFDNSRCLACGREAGFDPASLQLVAVESGEGDNEWHLAGGSQRYLFCLNREWHCNWLLDAGDSSGYCASCRLTRTLPNLARDDNLMLWTRLEGAKRRLLYDLLSLGLSIDEQRLRFEFLEDKRTNPMVREMHVYTGHRDGVITINVAEADDAAREAIREAMGESYRTLLGHLRHESGHYYWSVVVDTEESLAECRSLFGDEREDYQAALQRYHGRGPAAGGASAYVSDYASSHPTEDWAECWAHFLHIADTLETAANAGLLLADVSVRDEHWLDHWTEVVVALNELNRSLGLRDAYPFSLSPVVRDKLAFIRRRVLCSSSPA